MGIIHLAAGKVVLELHGRMLVFCFVFHLQHFSPFELSLKHEYNILLLP